MKIRIKGNSIRFRLTKSEVENLCENGLCREKTTFDEVNFVYAVKASEQYKDLHALFLGNGIILNIPKANLSGWFENDQVGFYHSQELGCGEKLQLTLEKDFACMDETSEDQSDNYPNPKKSITL